MWFMGRNGYIEEISTKIGEDPLECRQIEEMLDEAFCREGGSFEEIPGIEEKAARRFGVMSLVVVITLLALFCFSVRNSLLARHGFKFFQEHADLSFDEAAARKIMTLDTDAELLCYGDPEASPENRMKALWESQPEEGAYYLEHLKTYEREKGELPDGWQEQSEKVFPKNGVAYLLQASIFNDDLLSEKPTKEGLEPLSVATLSDGDSWRDYVVAFEVNDDEAYQHWVESMDKAMSYPELDFYSRQVMDERYLAFAEPTTLIEFSSRLLYIFSWIADFQLSQKRNVDLLAYRVGLLATAGDVAGVRKLEEQWLRLIEANSQSGLLINYSVSMAMASTALNFAEAEMVLGEKERSRIFLDLAIWQLEQRESRVGRSDYLIDAGTLDIMAITDVGQYAPEVEIKDQDIKTSRLAGWLSVLLQGKYFIGLSRRCYSSLYLWFGFILLLVREGKERCLGVC